MRNILQDRKKLVLVIVLSVIGVGLLVWLIRAAVALPQPQATPEAQADDSPINTPTPFPTRSERPATSPRTPGATASHTALTPPSPTPTSTQSPSPTLSPSLTPTPTIVVDLRVQKLAPGEIEPGAIITYTLLLKNESEGSVQNITLKDQIPLAILDPNIITPTGEVVDNEVVWHIETLAEQASSTFIWQGVVDPTTLAPIVDSAVSLIHNDQPLGVSVARTLIYANALRLEKRATALTLPGRVLTSSLLLENISPISLPIIAVSESVAACIRSLTEISNGGELVEAASIRWSLNDIPPNAAINLSWQGIACIESSQAMTLENTSVVTAGVTFVRNVVTRTVVKPLSFATEATNLVGPSETITYSITLHNPTDVHATNIEVRNPITDYVLNPSNISHGGQPQNEEIVWRLAELTAQQVLTLSWQGVIEPLIPATVTELMNTASFHDDVGQVGTAKTETKLRPQTLTSTMTAPPMVWPGGVYSTTLRVGNGGEAILHEVEIRNPLPPYVIAPGDISADGMLDGSDIVWRLDRLPAGAVADLGWQGLVALSIPSSETKIHNQASIKTGGGLFQETTTESMLLPEVLTLTVSAPEQAAPGAGITYLLTLHNSGSGQLDEVQARSHVSEYLINPTILSGNGVFENSNEIVWTLNEVAAGASQSLSWEGIVNPDIPLTVMKIPNQITATLANNLPITSVITTRILQPAIELSLAGPGVMTPGGLLTYTLYITNTGETVLSDVTVTDPVPTFVLTPTNISVGGVVKNGVLMWSLGPLTPTQTTTAQWQGTLDPLVSFGTLIVNQALVTTTNSVSDQMQVVTLVN